jgi:hypothetical protein
MFGPKESDDLSGSPAILLTDDADPTFELQPRAILPRSDRTVVAAQRIGQTSYLATDVGNVYRISATGQLTAYAQTPVVIAAAGNGTATRLVTLHQDGMLWRADWQDGDWKWSQLRRADPSATDVQMSPDGRKILLSFAPEGKQRLMMVDAESGQPAEDALIEAETAVSTGWNRDGDLAVVKMDGSVMWRKAGDDAINTASQKVELGQDATVRSAHFFTESWSKPQKEEEEQREPTLWLMVQTVKGDRSYIEYVALGESLDSIYKLAYAKDLMNREPFENEEDVKQAIEELAKESDQRLDIGDATTIVACSPKEGILATGSRDNVTVRFAAPSLNKLGQKLFSLEGHGGARIESLEFSADGNTLVSTDSLNRVYGWLSEDDLGVRPELQGGNVGSSSTIVARFSEP